MLLAEVLDRKYLDTDTLGCTASLTKNMAGVCSPQPTQSVFLMLGIEPHPVSFEPNLPSLDFLLDVGHDEEKWGGSCFCGWAIQMRNFALL